MALRYALVAVCTVCSASSFCGVRHSASVLHFQFNDVALRFHTGFMHLALWVYSMHLDIDNDEVAIEELVMFDLVFK